MTTTPWSGEEPIPTGGKPLFIVKRQPDTAQKIARLIDTSDQK